MVGKTRKLMDEVNDLMDLCVKNIDTHTIEHMSVDEFTLLQKCVKIVKLADELVIEQACMMDDMNRKLDKVLRILEKES